MQSKARKLRLDVDALTVESFRTDDEDALKRGTVHGYSPPCTMYGTCQDTCANTCAGPTCEPPCEGEPTLYMTCMDGCYWVTGNPCIAGIR